VETAGLVGVVVCPPVLHARQVAGHKRRACTDVAHLFVRLPQYAGSDFPRQGAFVDVNAGAIAVVVDELTPWVFVTIGEAELARVAVLALVGVGGRAELVLGAAINLVDVDVVVTGAPAPINASVGPRPKAVDGCARA